MKLARRTSGGAIIPTSSMSDIAFLLLLFFMVTTVFSTVKGLDVIIPKAEATERIRLRSNVVSVWVDKDGLISIDDKIIPPHLYSPKIVEKQDELIKRGRDLVVLLRIDQNARYGLINDLIDKMREVKALKITFATQAEET